MLLLLLLATDKTMLTQHHGDLAVCPVYLTTGDPGLKTRKSQIRPGMVLIGLIPVVKVGKEPGTNLRSEAHHKAMEHILECGSLLKAWMGDCGRSNLADLFV